MHVSGNKWPDYGLVGALWIGCSVLANYVIKI